MGYKTVYPEEAIRGHRAFITRRRATRPSEEYRSPTDSEWEEFLGHFERRRVALGDCGRAYSTSCIHEHSCIRCPLLRIDPAQRSRLEDIRDNLLARITEAEREGWTGEAEGLKVSLAAANNKIAQADATAARRTEAVSLGIPAYRDIAAATLSAGDRHETAMTTDDLTAALRACAAGLYPLEAGVALLTSNGTFLHRDDFTSRFISHETSGGTPMTAIDWQAAITALASGDLAAGTPVDLHDTVTGLDDGNTARLVIAIQHASGKRPRTSDTGILPFVRGAANHLSFKRQFEGYRPFPANQWRRQWPKRITLDDPGAQRSRSSERSGENRRKDLRHESVRTARFKWQQLLECGLVFPVKPIGVREYGHPSGRRHDPHI